MNLFGTKKAAPPKLSDTIKQLREALVRRSSLCPDCVKDLCVSMYRLAAVVQDTLDKREKHLEKQVVAAITEAKKKSKAKDKRGTGMTVTSLYTASGSICVCCVARRSVPDQAQAAVRQADRANLWQEEQH
jgi:hypothetical protein